MFDIGWTELLVIAVVLIVVVGPKDLPPMLRAFGKTMTRFRKVAGEFRAQFDEALKEADLDEVRQHISDAQKLNPANSLREAMNPLRQMGNDIKADLQRSTMVDRPQTAETQMLPAAPATAIPEVPAETAPVIAPLPEALAQTAPAKAKAVRKPRVKAVEAPVVVEPTNIVVAKPKRAPRKSAAGLAVGEAVVTEPQGASAAEQEASAMLVEPAQVGLSEAAAKPKRATRKSTATVVAEDVPVAPKSATAPRKPTKKKDDA